MYLPDDPLNANDSTTSCVTTCSTKSTTITTASCLASITRRRRARHQAPCLHLFLTTGSALRMEVRNWSAILSSPCARSLVRRVNLLQELVGVVVRWLRRQLLLPQTQKKEQSQLQREQQTEVLQLIRS
ncbi:unnamed protein product [Amoebophrya sp. A25]|nr:unnamed protein product [Amoebophrya sp. A25]|eukprot:GSA25T00020346001.1